MQRTLMWAVPLLVATGCGGIPSILFPSRAALPENYRAQSFLTRNSPQDLLVDMHGVVKGDITAAVRGFAAGDVPLQSALKAFLSLENDLGRLRSGASDLVPAGVPDFPNAAQTKTALENSAQEGGKEAVSPAEALTAAAQPPLFVRRDIPFHSSSETVHLWKKPSLPFVFLPPDLAARSVSETAVQIVGGSTPPPLEAAPFSTFVLSTRTLYARSLFQPRKAIRAGVATTLTGEPFQISVQCAKISVVRDSGTHTFAWPRIVIFEADTGSAAVVRHTVVRNDLQWDSETEDFSTLEAPSFTEIARQTSSGLFLHAVRRYPNTLLSSDVFWYARQSSPFFFSRFGSLLGESLQAQRVFASFQVGVSAFVLKDETAVLSDGSVAPLSAEQILWLSRRGSQKEKAPGDDWVKGLVVRNISQEDWHQSPDFSRTGIHYLDPELANGALLRGATLPSPFSNAFPFSQQTILDNFCAQEGAR